MNKSLYPNITIEKTELQDNYVPLEWPGLPNLDECYIKTLITRMISASYLPPHSFSSLALSSTAMMKLLRQASVTLSNEGNVVDVIVPFEGCAHVFGDIHGDIHSLVNALDQTGLPSPKNILVFAGDYVDRGPWGVEVLAIILFMKIWRPDCIFVLRGNHETTSCIKRYGFEDEVKYKYSSKIVRSFTNVFRQLPLVAVLRTLPPPVTSSSSLSSSSASIRAQPGKPGKRKQTRATTRQWNQNASPPQYPWSGSCQPGERRIMVMHGGLFRSEASRQQGRNEIALLTEVMDVSRRSDDPFGDMVEDILWSDPQLSDNGVAHNHLRGCGILFGETALDFFLKKNELHGVIRAHEGPDMREQRQDMPHIQNGYSIDMEVSSGYLLTMFSTANYPIQQPRGNKGAFATLYGKGHQSSSLIPHFTMFDRKQPPTDVHLFYTAESGGCCTTPRASVS